MLGLGHQVGRDHHGLGRGIGQHADLGGTGDHIDTHVTRDNLFGSGDKGVARAGDFVDARNGLGTVRQCGHGLGATPTAIVNMTAVTERYGMSSRAFMVVPIVGAFLVDIIYQPQTIAFIKFFVPAASNLVG